MLIMCIYIILYNYKILYIYIYHMYPPTYAYYLISNELPISHGLFNSCSPGATACDLLTALRSPTVDVEDWKTDWDRMSSTYWNCLKNAESIEESVPSGKHTKNYGKSPFSMGKSTISMVIFNSYFDITRGYLGTGSL